MVVIDKNKIYNEDCMETMERMDENEVDLVLTDIPYGEVNRDDNGLRNLDKESADVVNFNLEKFLCEVKRITIGSIYIWCGINQVSYIREYLDQDLSTRVIVWKKSNPTPLNGKKLWLSGIELCVYAKKSGATFNGHCDNTVLQYPCGSSKDHPTEKNLDLFKELIEKSSNDGGLVYDPMCGSGTTMVACEKLNREWIGSEISEEYYDIARERIKRERDQLKAF